MVQILFICCKFNHLPKNFLPFFCFALFLILSEDISQGNIFLAINRKSMVKQVSLCWTYRFYKARAAHIYIYIWPGQRAPGDESCLFLSKLPFVALSYPTGWKGKGAFFSFTQTHSHFDDKKACCFPMCLCSSDSRPIETSWWSSLKIIGPIIFTGNAAMRASKTEIMTARSGCTVERQSVIMSNFWLSSPHLCGRGGGRGKAEMHREGAFPIYALLDVCIFHPSMFCL